MIADERERNRATKLWWWQALVPIAVAITMAVIGYVTWERNTYVFDDAYISYRYADNFAHGHGLVYNLGERVQGYTNLLWTLLAACAIRLGLDPLIATQTLGVASHVVMLALVASFAVITWQRLGTWAYALLPLLLVLVLPKGFAAISGSGLESSFVGLLLVVAGLGLGARSVDRWPMRVALSVVLTLAVLTRLDCLAAVGAAVVAIVVARWVSGGALRPALVSALVVGGAATTVAATLLLWTYAYYGDFLPNTYYAKAANVPHLREGFAYVAAFARAYGQATPLLLLTLAGTCLRSSERLKRMSIYAALTVLAELVHIVRVGGDFMEYRFMWQLYGLLGLGAVIAVAHLARESRGSALVVAATLLAVSFQDPKLEAEFGMQAPKEMNSYTQLGTTIGKRLGQVLPDETIVATTLAGTVAYFSRLTVIDQWGLNDRFTAQQPFTADRMSRGHVKGSPESYLRKRGVNLFIHHPVICSCSSPWRENKPNVFIRLEDGKCLRTWYLEQDPELTKYFCSNPSVFVLNKVSCDGDNTSVARRQSAKRKSPPVASK